METVMEKKKFDLYTAFKNKPFMLRVRTSLEDSIRRDICCIKASLHLDLPDLPPVKSLTGEVIKMSCSKVQETEEEYLVKIKVMCLSRDNQKMNFRVKLELRTRLQDESEEPLAFTFSDCIKVLSKPPKNNSNPRKKQKKQRLSDYKESKVDPNQFLQGFLVPDSSQEEFKTAKEVTPTKETKKEASKETIKREESIKQPKEVKVEKGEDPFTPATQSDSETLGLLLKGQKETKRMLLNIQSQISQQAGDNFSAICNYLQSMSVKKRKSKKEDLLDFSNVPLLSPAFSPIQTPLASLNTQNNPMLPSEELLERLKRDESRVSSFALLINKTCSPQEKEQLVRILSNTSLIQQNQQQHQPQSPHQQNQQYLFPGFEEYDFLFSESMGNFPSPLSQNFFPQF